MVCWCVSDTGKDGEVWLWKPPQEEDERCCKQPLPKASVTQVVKKRKRSRGGGGAARAFVSMQTRGSKGRPRFSSLMQEFKAAKASNTPLYQRSVAMGRAGTERHRQSSQASFGPSQRMIARKRQVMSASARPAALRDTVLSTSLVPSTRETGLALTVTLDLEDDLRMLRATARRQAIHKKQLERSQAVIQQQHLATIGPAVQERTYSAFPELLPLATSLHVQARVSYHLFEFCPDSVPLSTLAADWALTQKRTHDLHECLSLDWERKNTCVREPEQVESAERQALQVGSCLKHGMCIHTAEGQAVRKCLLRLHQFLKGCFRSRDPEAKKSLQDGWVVLHLSPPIAAPPTDSLPPDHSGWDDATDRYLTETPDEVSPTWKEGVWLHVGSHYFKPYRSTFQKLAHVAELPCDRYRLQQTLEFFTEMEVLQNLCLDQVWMMSAWSLLATSQPVAPLDPSVCEVGKLKVDQVPSRLWPPPPRARRSTRRGSDADPLRGTAEDVEPGAATTDEAAVEGERLDEDDAEPDVQELSDDAESGQSEDPAFSELLDFFDSAELLADAEAEDATEEAQAGDLAEAEAAARPVAPTPPTEGEEQGDSVPGAGEDQAAAAGLGEDTAPAALPKPAGPPPPPKAAGLAPRPAAGLRVPATATTLVPGGKLTWYRQGYFTAMCDLHHRCVMTRTSSAGRRPGQGRPLGFLTAWLAAAATHHSKEEHFLKDHYPTLAERQAARASLRDRDGGADLLEQERPLRAGEEKEPEVFP